ncbi:MAG: YdcF family protein [Lachnospiraceae bacterium]|nr:YdcF family protein [Candidatus Equihabitans merdae]
MIYIMLYLCITTVIMAFALSKSLKRTIYSYTNIGLIGSILFHGVFLIVTFHYLFTRPTFEGDSLLFAYQSIVAFPRIFSYYAVFVIMFICLLLGISNISLMKHERVCLQNALSLLVAALYVGGTFAIYFIADKMMSSVFVPLGLADKPLFIVLNTVIPLYLLLMLCYFECILAGSAIMGWVAARAVPKYDKDYIIILGCSIDKRGGLFPLLRGRVNKAIRYAWDQEIASGKPLKYIPSGGQGPNEVMSEGSAMAFYLLTHGAEEYEVIPEKASRNTYENFLFSKKIIDELNPHAKVAFATTNYHILRSGILAQRVGLNAEGIAGDTKWYFWPNGFVREFFGILALEKKVHLWVAAIMAVVCIIIAIVQFSIM